MRLPNAEDSRSIATQHLAFIERHPRPKWFVTSPNEAGEQEVYLNFEVTGWYPKFYGPFPNQDAALKCLNELLISLAIRSMMPGWRPTSRNRTSVTVGFRQLLYDRLGNAARLMMRGPRGIVGWLRRGRPKAEVGRDPRLRGPTSSGD